jgi:hypothetical protein
MALKYGKVRDASFPGLSLSPASVHWAKGDERPFPCRRPVGKATNGSQAHEHVF